MKHTHQKSHSQESLPEQKMYNSETELYNEHDTSIPFVHENPFLLQEFNLAGNVNECEYIKQILHVCPNLHTLDGKICGVNALELVSLSVVSQKKENESEQPVLSQQKQKVDNIHQSTNNFTSRSHSFHVRVDSNKVENIETKPRRSHSRPLLTSPHAASNDKNVIEMTITPTSSSSTSSSCSPESTLSSHTREGSKVANDNNTTSTSTKSSAARSLDYSATKGNELEKSLLSEESSYDVSLIEAELNDVLCKQQKENDNHVRQELHSVYNNTYHGRNNNLYGYTNYDILHNYGGKNSKSASQNVLLSNFVFEKMPEIDKSADGEMELCELRSGRPVHSLRWRPHRRSIGLNTFISINTKEKFDKRVDLEQRTESTQRTNTNTTISVSENKSKNDDNNKISSVNDKANSDVEQTAEGSMSTQKMQRMLDAFGLHSELVDALSHEKKEMTKRLGKAMQQMALQRATEMELHQEIAFARKSLSQYKVGSTHTINKQQSQISSLKDELLRRAGEIQIMHKRSNADLTSLQERLTRRCNSNINT